jgi:peptidoglycan/xylan/chitin deacetylase (PgdA/CDA1 family)
MKGIVLLICTLFTVCFFYPIAVTAGEYDDLDDTEVFFKREREANVRIIMYHLVTEKGKYIGKYGITPTELEADLKYLKENGYRTVVMADLIAFVQRGKKLPKKPVVLTFDDGNTGDLNYVLPLLEKYDMKAVFSVIGEAAERFTKEQAAKPNAKFPNLTWPQIKEMHDSGLCEIQSHGYNLHGRGGAGKRGGEATAVYHARLRADLQRLQSLCHEHLEFTPTTFTYPLGVIHKDAQAVLEELGFVATLSCQEGMNRLIQGDPKCLMRLKRSNRPSGKPIRVLLDALEK